MMQWINEWLKEIILIIMLAVFVDLLLPGKMMQRYVKVILSLIILVTMMTPLIHLFKADFNFGFWEDDAIDVSQFQALDSVLEEGEKLRSYNEGQAIRVVEEQLSQLMLAELERELPGEISEVAVAMAVNEKGEQYNIHRVTVKLATQREQPEHSIDEGEELIDDIAAVKPVVINIEIDHINEEHVLKVVGEHEDRKNTQLEMQISRILEHNWHVSSNQLTIISSEEVSGLMQEVKLWGNFYKSWSNG